MKEGKPLGRRVFEAEETAQYKSQEAGIYLVCSEAQQGSYCDLKRIGDRTEIK